jgi:CDP-diglyceride synthetase
MGARQKEQIHAMMEGPVGTAVRWYFLVFGAIVLALTLWNGYRALTQRDPSKRTAAVKFTVVGVPWTCSALILVLQPPSAVLNKLFGPSVGLSWGLLLLLFPEWLGPRFAMVAKRGLAFIFIGSGLLIFLTWPFPDFDYSDAQLIWPAVVVLVCAVAKVVASRRVQPSTEDET